MAGFNGVAWFEIGTAIWRERRSSTARSSAGRSAGRRRRPRYQQVTAGDGPGLHAGGLADTGARVRVRGVRRAGRGRRRNVPAGPGGRRQRPARRRGDAGRDHVRPPARPGRQPVRGLFHAVRLTRSDGAASATARPRTAVGPGPGLSPGRGGRSLACGMSRSSRRSARGAGTCAVTRDRGDAVGAEGAERVAQPAPGQQVPALGDADVAERLDVPAGDEAVPVGVADPQHPARGQGIRDHDGQRRRVRVADQVDAAARSRAASASSLRIAASTLRMAAAASWPNGVPATCRSATASAMASPAGEVDRRQRAVLVQAVAAGPPGLGPHRHAGLLQRADVPLDRAGADLEPAGQPPRAARPRRDGPQFLHEGVQPVGPVHAHHDRSGLRHSRRRVANRCATLFCRAEDHLCRRAGHGRWRFCLWRLLQVASRADVVDPSGR